MKVCQGFVFGTLTNLFHSTDGIVHYWIFCIYNRWFENRVVKMQLDWMNVSLLSPNTFISYHAWKPYISSQTIPKPYISSQTITKLSKPASVVPSVIQAFFSNVWSINNLNWTIVWRLAPGKHPSCAKNLSHIKDHSYEWHHTIVACNST